MIHLLSLHCILCTSEFRMRCICIGLVRDGFSLGLLLLLSFAILFAPSAHGRVLTPVNDSHLLLPQFQSLAQLPSGTLEFKNHRGTPVKILRVLSGCSCVVVEVSGTAEGGKVEPDEHIFLNLSLKPELVRHGENTVDLLIVARVEDEVLEEKIASVTYHFDPSISVSSEKISINTQATDSGRRSGMGGGSVRIIDYQSSNENRLVITDVVTSNPFLEFFVDDSFTLDTTGKARHRIDVYAILAPGWPVGSIDEKLTIKTNRPSHGSFEIAVVGEVKSPIVTSPEVVYLGDLRVGDRFERTVELADRDNQEIAFTVEASTERLNVEVRPNVAGQGTGSATLLNISGAVTQEDVAFAEDNPRYWQSLTLRFTEPYQFDQTVRIWGHLTLDDTP